MDAAGATARLFFGLPIEGALRAPLEALARALAAASGGRAAPAADLHATIAFLGSLPHDRIAPLRAIGAALGADAVEVTLDTVGSFRAARVAWIGPSRVPRGLTALHAALTAKLAASSFALDARPYHPHVTLARHCRKALPRAGIEPLEWRIERVVLYESIGATGGPRYEERAAWPLTRRR